MVDAHLKKIIMEGTVSGQLLRGGAKKRKSAGSKKAPKRKVAKKGGSKKAVIRVVKRAIGGAKRPDMVDGKFTSAAAKRRSLSALKKDHKKQIADLKKIKVERKKAEKKTPKKVNKAVKAKRVRGGSARSENFINKVSDAVVEKIQDANQPEMINNEPNYMQFANDYKKQITKASRGY